MSDGRPAYSGLALIVFGMILALWQDQIVSGDPLSTLIPAVINALTIGGGLATGGAFLLREIGKRLDEQRAMRAEERAADQLRQQRWLDEMVRVSDQRDQLIKEMIGDLRAERDELRKLLGEAQGQRPLVASP